MTLRSGRLRLVTSPDVTGSLPIAKTIGMVEVADFAAKAAGVPLMGRDQGHLMADQIGRQRRQPVELACRPRYSNDTLRPSK